VIIPGLVNKIGAQSNRIVPRRWITKFAAKINKAK
jgi:hypothetical protein